MRLIIALQVLQTSLAQHWARDWRALALTQVHHWSRLSDSREDGEALSSVHSTALAAGKAARGSVDRTAYSPKYLLSFMSHHAAHTQTQTSSQDTQPAP